MFEYNENNGEIGALTSTVTATALNTTGQVYFQFLVDGVAHNDVNHGTGPIAGSVVDGNYTAQITYDPPASFTNMPQVIECRIREVTGTAAGTILARDQIGMIGAKEGSGAYQVYMENSAHVVPATRTNGGSGDATTLDMTNSNPGFIAVFKGATRLTLVTSGTPTTGQFKVTSVTQSPASNAGGISTVDQSAAVQNDGGPGDGKDAGTGYRYNGPLTAAELMPVPSPVGQGNYGDLKPGDTIEVHYVHRSVKVKPGPGLGSCVSPSINNPQLRVETIVAVLVNDSAAADFQDLNAIKRLNGFYQATGLPEGLGEHVTYAGSTTGPISNKQGSPFQVTWNVRPRVLKVDIASVDRWLKDNPFEETAAHGVRNLVQNQMLLSPIR